jgi:(1->4)-alpha-D-glucan 1-alpha-D-glucosylmutase
VFEATHELLLELVASGTLTGLRIDHPDGLADPRGYLERLAGATGGTWVVVEKILEGEETLPADWPCAGTTGYDTLMRVGGLFLDPAGAAPLTSLLNDLTDRRLPDFEQTVETAKREVVEHGLYAEVERLVGLLVEICRADIALRDHTRRHLTEAVVELLVAFGRYRAYVVPGEEAPAESVEAVQAAAAAAAENLSEESRDALALVVDLVLGRPVGRGSSGGRDEARRRGLVVRFQQTCGPVMAKGVEDTAFYRWPRLTSLNEVGGDPLRFGVVPEEFHAYAATLQRDWPVTMTTLSTHDTKRSEDVRARLGVLSEIPQQWAEAVTDWNEASVAYRSHESRPDPETVYLIWQTLVGTWRDGPLSIERLLGYLTKATREAKLHTRWTDPDTTYEAAVEGFARSVLLDEHLVADVGAFCAEIAGPARVAVLGQKLVQLAMPGVPDVYQGCELVDLSLVDPDNRRDVDFAGRRERLARLDAGEKPHDLDDEKLLITSRTLRLRREHPEWFTGPDAAYWPMATTTGNAFAFARGDGAGPAVVAVATRLPVALARHGGWAGHTLALPPGQWHDALTGREVPGGSVPLVELLDPLPVALLTR